MAYLYGAEAVRMDSYGSCLVTYASIHRRRCQEVRMDAPTVCLDQGEPVGRCLTAVAAGELWKQ